MGVKWTEDQKNAIEAGGGSVLVSAAAGSGKTAVLTSRVIGHITREQNPSSLDRLMVVTYSNAAAAEMRHRIGKNISQQLAITPENSHLIHQQMLLENAKICTIHAFCLELLRDHFVAAGLTEDFRLSDEQELSVIRGETLRELLLHRYSEAGNEFLEMVELISNSKNDNRVEQTILKLYDFVRSHPFYEHWLSEKKSMYDPDVPLVESSWGRVLLDYVGEGMQYMGDILERAIDDMDEDIKKAYGDAFAQDAGMARLWQGMAEQSKWDELVVSLRGYKPARLGALRGYEYPERKQAASAVRDKFKSFFGDLAGKYCTATQPQHRQDMEFLGPRVATLFDIVTEFDDRFSQAKRQRKIVDFSDLEHMALQLLVERREGQYFPKNLAKQISMELDEILVDEYQDTNEVQELLFVTLSRSEQNLFFVGDVKQSIYRFRQAMPQLFLSRRENSVAYDGKNFPARILLRNNFRSRHEVTGAVNEFFHAVMSPKVGEMDYTAEDELVCSANYPDTTRDLRTELHVIDPTHSQEHRRIAQSNYVADYINTLLQSRMMVGSGDDLRPIQPGDICILLRSVKGRADDYLSALGARDIPAMADVESDFLSTVEISAVISLLEAADNPLLDLSLAKALMSPIIDFSADDLAAIRLHSPSGGLYTALLDRAKTDKRASDAVQLLEELRRYAAAHSADRVILRLYEITGFLQTARVMPWGEQRQSNLRLLIDYARDFELRGIRGISGFLSFLGRLREQEKDLSAGFCKSRGAVSVMTIHHSKGLEFPVVIMADLDKGFNKLDLQSSSLLHSGLGFACKRRDTQRMIEYTTLPLAALRLVVQAEQLSEEMRVMYVAMTRAKEKLVLMAAPDKPQNKLAGLQVEPTLMGKLPPWEVRRAGSYFDWIAMLMMCHPDGELLREQVEIIPNRIMGGEGGIFSVYFESSHNKEEVEDVRLESFEMPAPDSGLLEELCKSADFVYPYAPSVSTPSKFAISKLSHKQVGGFSTPKRPTFLQTDELSAAQRGDATHKFMQYADYDAATAHPDRELERLVQKGYLTPEEGRGVDLAGITRFFDSPLAKRIQNADAVYRERSFMGELSASELAVYTDAVQGDENVVLQGIADCIIVENGLATVIDYKTDRVKTAELLKNRYTVQLCLYKRLLQPLLGCEVSQCYIYSFHLGESILLD